MTIFASVSLREITVETFKECISLQVEESQTEFVASNVRSLAEAKVNRTLRPFAVYDGAELGCEVPLTPMVGFVMYEVTAGTGFILRIMIDKAHQGRGYGRATVVEVIRRLRLYPEVQIIGTSHKIENVAAASLYRSLGFVHWNLPGTEQNKEERFLKLDLLGL